MKSKLIFLLLSLLSCIIQTQATELSGKRKAAKRTGDVIFVAAPVTCLITTLILKDYQGLKQGVFTGVTALGATYALKFAVGKERPDGSNSYSFPSAHTAVTFAGAGFLQRRYGWKWGGPAYALAGYVGWSRVYGKKHDWWDVVAGAALGAGCAYIYTRPFAKKYEMAITPVATPSYMGLHASLQF